VQEAVFDRLVDQAKVHAAHGDAKEYAANVLHLSRGYGIVKARSGYVVLRTRDVFFDEEVVALRKREQEVKEKLGVSTTSSWIRTESGEM